MYNSEAAAGSSGLQSSRTGRRPVRLDDKTPWMSRRKMPKATRSQPQMPEGTSSRFLRPAE